MPGKSHGQRTLAVKRERERYIQLNSEFQRRAMIDNNANKWRKTIEWEKLEISLLAYGEKVLDS